MAIDLLFRRHILVALLVLAVPQIGACQFLGPIPAVLVGKVRVGGKAPTRHSGTLPPRKPAIADRVRGVMPLLAVLAIAGSSFATSPKRGARFSARINAGWKYLQGDVAGADLPGFDDSQWQSIGLPHSFSIPYFMSPDFYVGYGWYRHHLDVPDNWSGKRLSLEFDGVFQEAEVFVNGSRAGVHKGGYTGFSVDITPFAKIGDNTVAVRVNNLWNPRLAPRAGEHVFSGGIYRTVRLVVTDPVHIPWCGISVTTPQVSSERAIVEVSTRVANSSQIAKTVTIRHQVRDPDGKIVAVIAGSRGVGPDSQVEIALSSKELTKPCLWDPDHPYLYSLTSTVLDGNRIIDQITTSFGIRSIRWTADQGFFLNGKHLYLRGANVHQDQAGWGDAITEADMERDVRFIKDAGFNFIRGSHYPHAPGVLEACDRLGVLFWCENDFWSTASSHPEGYWNGSGYPTLADDQPAFEESSKRQLAEMIQIHRNHPSIIAWSMCNEPFFSAGSTMPKVRTFLRDLVELTHKLDPSRPAALGGVQRPTDTNRIDRLGDIAGYNGDGAGIAEFQNPGVPNMVSEYGSTATERPGAYDPNWGDLEHDRGEAIKPWRAGQAIWAGFDHGSIFGARFGRMGIVDYFRIPKRAWFWYRNAYKGISPPEWPKNGTPSGLSLTTDKASNIRTDGTDDAHLVVTVQDVDGNPISNCPPVELTIVKGPGEFPTGRTIKFERGSDIPIIDGQAAITIRSYFAGSTVVQATSPGLKSGRVSLKFTGPTPFPGESASHLSRPYVRFTKMPDGASTQLFGHNCPVFASSALEGHPGALAVDGDPATYWQPTQQDSAPRLTFDLERIVALKVVRLRFKSVGASRLILDVSDDQTHWHLVGDLSQVGTAKDVLQVEPNPGSSGRFVRVRFEGLSTSDPIQLSGFELVGRLLL